MTLVQKIILQVYSFFKQIGLTDRRWFKSFFLSLIFFIRNILRIHFLDSLKINQNSFKVVIF